MTAAAWRLPYWLEYRDTTSARLQLDLPPEQAIAFFQAKGLKPTFSYLDMLRSQHDQAFTVAKMMDVDLLADVRQAVDQAIAQGWSARQFRDQLIPTLQAKGWWGKAPMTDPATGQVVQAQLGSPWRLNTIYRTNLQSAYAAGKWEGIVEGADVARFLMYDAVDDHRTRPEHRQWDGRVLAVDDKFWDTHYPPNGWNCRCGVIQLREDQLPAVGKVGPDPSPKVKRRKWKNPRTGKTHLVARDLDPGWDYHPGKGQQAHLTQLLAEKVQALPPELGAAAKRADAAAQQAREAYATALAAKAAQLQAAKEEAAAALARAQEAAAERAKQLQAQGQLEAIAAGQADDPGKFKANALKQLSQIKGWENGAPAAQLGAVLAKAAQLKEKHAVQTKLSGYKKKLMEGKPPTPAQKAAFDQLAPEEQEAFLAKVEAAKAKAAQEAAPPPPGPAAAPGPEDVTAGTTPAKPIAWERLTKTGRQKGSNPGGFYTDTETGEQWYVKMPASEDIARNEVLAARLYEAAGVEVPELQFFRLPDGRAAVASRIVDDVSFGGPETAWDQVAGAHDGFAVDAWLANWDVLGPDWQNMYLKGGRAIRGDVGGALRYRAQGGQKGAAFGDQVLDLDSIRDPSLNLSGHTAFQGITQESLERGVAKVAGVSDEQIRYLVTAFGGLDADATDALVARLIARRDDLVRRYPGAVAPKPQAPPPLPGGAVLTDMDRANVKAARGNGYVVPTDGPDVEDHAVLLFEERDELGQVWTTAWLKLRGQAARRLEREASRGAGAGVDLADLDQKVLTALKGIAARPNEALRAVHVQRVDEAAAAFQEAMRAMQEAGYPLANVQQMRAHYRPWLQALMDARDAGEGNVPSWNPPGYMFEGFTAPPPPAQAAAGRAWKKRSTTWARKQIDRGHLREDGGTAGSYGQHYESGDATGRVRFWGGKIAGYRALEDQLEIRRLGGAEDAGERVFEDLASLGVTAKRATAADREELYLRQIAYHQREGFEDLDRAANGIADQQERLEYLRARVSAQAGVEDITALPGYAPQGQRQAFETGRVHTYRPDLQGPEWQEFTEVYRLHHEITGDSGGVVPVLDRILNSGGQMAPTTDKLRRGIPLSGMSPTADLDSGGAAYFFARIKTKGNAHMQRGLVWKSRLVGRLDAISYNGDKYGDTRGDFVLRNRKTGVEEWKQIARIGNNETVLKGSLSLFDDLDVIVTSGAAEREQVIAVLRRHGLEQWPDGRSLYDVVVAGY